MRALIIADLHGNVEALRAIEKTAGDVDHVLFLGDVLDYGPNPKECMNWLRERASLRLLGNHDNAVARGVDCQCGSAFKELSTATREYTRSILDDADIDDLRSLAPEARFEIDGLRIFAAHAAPSDPLFKYVRPSTPDDEIQAEAEKADAQIVLLGHTHFPMDRTIGGTRFVNPGSAGQPRDADPRAGFAIWKDGDVSLHRVEYDMEPTVRALETCPLAPRVIERLSEVLRTGK